MAENYKILAQSDLSGANAGNNYVITLYTVPALKQASISSLTIGNLIAGTSATYKVGVIKAVNSGTSGISNSQTIIPSRTISAGETDEIVGGITLAAGDQLRLYSQTNLAVHLYGVEIS